MASEMYSDRSMTFSKEKRSGASIMTKEIVMMYALTPDKKKQWMLGTRTHRIIDRLDTMVSDECTFAGVWFRKDFFKTDGLSGTCKDLLIACKPKSIWVDTGSVVSHAPDRLMP